MTPKRLLDLTLLNNNVQRPAESSGGVPMGVVSPKGISRHEGSDSVDCGVSL